MSHVRCPTRPTPGRIRQGDLGPLVEVDAIACAHGGISGARLGVDKIQHSHPGEEKQEKRKRGNGCH